MRFHSTEFDFYPARAFQPRPGGGMTLEGGKGSSTPPPDPRLIEAQIKSLGIQDSMVQQILQQSSDFAPVQKEQMQFGLDAARTAFGQSQADRDWSLGRRDELTKSQNTLINDAAKFDSGQRKVELQAEAIADTTAAFGNAKGQNTRNMNRMGINPNSGRSQAMDNDMALAQAAATAGASSKSGAAARAEGYAMTDRATNALAGFPAMSMQATGAGAAYGAAGLGLANNGLAGATAGASQASGIAGQMGSNATSMWGAQSNAYQQSQANDGAGMAGLGSAVGGIAMAI